MFLQVGGIMSFYVVYAISEFYEKIAIFSSTRKEAFCSAFCPFYKLHAFAKRRKNEINACLKS